MVFSPPTLQWKTVSASRGGYPPPEAEGATARYPTPTEAAAEVVAAEVAAAAEAAWEGKAGSGEGHKGDQQRYATGVVGGCPARRARRESPTTQGRYMEGGEGGLSS